ncbi:MAG: hypothetical protein AB7H96_24730 [Vicinamibacterales bacterium]
MRPDVEAAIGARWRAVLIQGGLSRNGRFYPADVLEAAAPRFNGAPVFVGHGAPVARERATVGRVVDVRYEVFTDPRGRDWPQVVGTLEIDDAETRASLLAWRQMRRRHLGVSAVMVVDSRSLTWDAADVWTWVTRITRVRSVDLVDHPAAGGRVLGIVTGGRGRVSPGARGRMAAC